MIRLACWLLFWYASISLVLDHTHTPGEALIGLTLLMGVVSFGSLMALLLFGKRDDER